MSARQSLVDELIRDEGLRLKPYMDSVGKITIGVGRNLSDDGLSNAEAMALLDHDVDEAVADLAGSFPWFLQLDEVRQRAMVNLRFNVGATGFRSFARMIRMMAAKNYAQAAASMRDSKWYRQVGERGARLVHMILTGTD